MCVASCNNFIFEQNGENYCYDICPESASFVNVIDNKYYCTSECSVNYKIDAVTIQSQSPIVKICMTDCKYQTASDKRCKIEGDISQKYVSVSVQDGTTTFAGTDDCATYVYLDYFCIQSCIGFIYAASSTRKECRHTSDTGYYIGDTWSRNVVADCSTAEYNNSYQTSMGLKRCVNKQQCQRKTESGECVSSCKSVGTLFDSDKNRCVKESSCSKQVYY